jgi:tRNA (guanine-N7-)-methyltransferase
VNNSTYLLALVRGQVRALKAATCRRTPNVLQDADHNPQNAGVFESPHSGRDWFSVIELIPESYVSPLDLERIFGRRAPLHVDLGCGDGSFLCALAQRMPKKNFLGLERLPGCLRAAARRAGEIANVRLLRLESSYAVQYLLSASSVETFYLLFPDPWPKRRHHRRRIVTPDFLDSVHAALGASGLLFFATDHLDYFREVKRVARNHSGFSTTGVAVCPTTSHPWRRRVGLPLTKFEQKFREQGVPIHWLELRKVSPVR